MSDANSTVTADGKTPSSDLLAKHIKSGPQLWLRNAWYQIGWSDEVKVAVPLVRTVLNQPLLIMRDERDRVGALLDRCPHRFAPLSAGRISSGIVTCGYHGLAFDASGACVRNPHGPIASAMHVQSYLVAERHTALWIWMGDPRQAHEEEIPDLSFIDDTPESARITIHMPTRCNYQLLTDNIMDLSHADYLHPTTLGGMMTAVKAQTREEGKQIIVQWHAIACDPPPAFRAMVPPPLKGDIHIEVRWSAPAVMVLTATAKPTGIAPTTSDESRTLHNMTPETATSSHYFVCSTRRFLMDDAHFNEFLRGALARAFQEEDKPMLESQQARIGDAEFWSLKPILLRVDAAAVQVRRRLDQLIAAESSS